MVSCPLANSHPLLQKEGLQLKEGNGEILFDQVHPSNESRRLKPQSKEGKLKVGNKTQASTHTHTHRNERKEGRACWMPPWPK